MRDDTMLRYTKARNTIISQLLDDPELNRLHHAALARAENRLAELRETEAYHALVADLAQASAVPISQIVAKPPQARDKEKIAALMSDVEKSRGAKAKAERKAGPKDAPVPAVPMGSYNGGAIDLSADVHAEVYTNHTMKVPLDGRVFAAHVLPLIQAGKFERGLARKMPYVLAKQARVLEIGSAVGFLAGHCANVRTDVHFTLQESNPGLRQMMKVVCHLSNRAFNDRFVLSDQTLKAPALDALELIVQSRPTTLMLADANLDLEALTQVFTAMPAPPPAQVFLYGRLLAVWHSRMDEVTGLLSALGYQPDYGFDPNIARGFSLGQSTDDEED